MALSNASVEAPGRSFVHFLDGFVKSPTSAFCFILSSRRSLGEG
jgi:hypothetical protein